MKPPIYSIKSHCRDCYKCVRHCPTKCIEVVDDHATINAEGCILCGNCVGVCSHSAKVVRDDLPRVQELLQHDKRVHVSLAPSFVSEFPGIEPAKIFGALKQLGFYRVHETAEGAELVSAEAATLINRNESSLLLSTACPVAVEYITHYYPQMTKYLTPIMPPVLAHAKNLKARYGANIRIVFIGPCIAKKRDADNNPDLLHTTLTFEELRSWMASRGIDPEQAPSDDEYRKPSECAIYPVEGGMNATILKKLNNPLMKNRLLTISGIDSIRDFLNHPEHLDAKQPLFIELLACPGGCIAGPKSSIRNTANAHLEILDYTGDKPVVEMNAMDISCIWKATPIQSQEIPESEIIKYLHLIGKYSKDDELNCGGCGYDSCRQLATALYKGTAEKQMCVSYMRQLAQKKNTALARALPYGLVIANATLKIVECNERFAQLIGGSLLTAYEAGTGLKSADLTRIIPLPKLFYNVLQTGDEVIRKKVKIDNRIFSISIFNVEPHVLIGALILDVTDKEERRLKLIEKSRTVIQNTTGTVQKIAYMLGQNSAQSELILNSAIEVFASEEIDDDSEDLY